MINTMETIVERPDVLSSFADMLGDVSSPDRDTANSAPITWRTKDDNDSDWTIVIDDKRYHVHKLALKQGRRNSIYFKNAFEDHQPEQIPETNLSKVISDLCKDRVFEAALDFVYDDRVHEPEFTAANAMPLIEIAWTLRIPTLFDAVWRELQARILDEKSAPLLLSHVIVLARKNEAMTKVRETTVAIMAAHFDRYETAAIAALPDTVATVSAILNSDRLVASPRRKSNALAATVRKCYQAIDARALAALVANARREGDVAPEDALLLMAKAYHVSPRNDKYGLTCAKVATAHFEQLTIDDLALLPHGAVVSVLGSTVLSVSSEDVVFDAIRRYVGAAELNAEQTATAWTTCRFAFLSCEKIAEALTIDAIPAAVLLGGIAVRVYRLEKHAYGNIAEVDAFTPRQWENNKRFTYKSDFDENGVLYYLGTKAGTAPWSNPADAGLIAVTRSSDTRGKASDAAGRSQSPAFVSSSKSSSGSWQMFDLGATRRVAPNYYSLRHGNTSGAYRLQSWVLEGSEDNEAWTVLKAHANDTSIPDAGGATKSWPVPRRGANSFFRYLRVRATGANSNSHHQLMLGGFEVYGTLREEKA